MKKIGFLALIILNSINLILAEEAVPLAATIPISDIQSDDCIRSPKQGSFDLKCDGLLFSLHVPKICLEKACGLILDVHGYRMTGDLQDYYTNISNFGEEFGYIVINPTAKRTLYGRSWSYTGEDDELVLSVLKRVRKVFKVMEERVHITGFSQGASMTWRFVCKYPEIIGSAAPLAFGAGSPINYESPIRIKVYDRCFNDTQVDILYGHGKNDALIDYSGALQTVKKIVESWNMDNVRVISKDPDYRRVNFSNTRGTTFQFISYDWETAFPVSLSEWVSSGSDELAGHCFPGEGNYLGCGKDNSFHWGKEVVNFFIDHPKRKK